MAASSSCKVLLYPRVRKLARACSPGRSLAPADLAPAADTNFDQV